MTHTPDIMEKARELVDQMDAMVTKYDVMDWRQKTIALIAAALAEARAVPDGWGDLVRQYQKLTDGKYKTAEITEQEESFDCPMCEGNGCVTGEQYINFDNKPLNVLFSGIGDEFVGWQRLFDGFVAMIAAAPNPPIAGDRL